jgi:uncharacterized membrane-anchored protein YhcB (DUF1043 family)
MSWLMFGLAMILGIAIGSIIAGSVLTGMLEKQQKRFNIEKEELKNKKRR